MSEPGRRLKRRREFHVVAHAVVQCEIVAYAPGILPEQSQGFVGERVGGITETLDKDRRHAKAVGLHRVKLGERLRKQGLGAEVIDAAIIHSEGGRERKIVEVPSELSVVPSDAPGKIVGELIAWLDALDVGVGLASEIGVTGNVDSWVGSARNLGVVEIIQAAASVLEAEFIHLAGAESPSILHHSRHVTVGLLRSARVGVLAEGLVLSADFDAGNRARAGIDAQREPVVIAHVVVDA